MADTRKITFSLDLTTDQAKHAVEEFQKQLGGLGQSMSSGLSDINRFSAATEDSFVKALNKFKSLSDQIQKSIKDGLLTGEAGTKAGSAVADLVASTVEKYFNDTKLAVEESAKKLAETQKRIKAIVESAGTGKITESDAGRVDYLTKLSEQQQKKLTAAEERYREAEKRKEAVAKGDIPTALSPAQQTPHPQQPGQQPPPFTGGGQAQQQQQYQGSAINTALLLNLLANGGSLVRMASPSGAMQALGMLGGPYGRIAATALSTVDEVQSIAREGSARSLEAVRQYQTGGYTSIESGFLAREMIKREGLGAHGEFQRGNLGVLGGLRSLYELIRHGGDLEAARSYRAEEELQKSMPFGRDYQRGLDITRERSENFYDTERMLGSERTNTLLTGLNKFGISDRRAKSAVRAAVEFGVPMDANWQDTRDLVSFQNRYGLSDAATRELVRMQSYSDSAMTNAAKAYSYAGIGGARGDQARGVLEEAAAAQTQTYGGQFAEQARTPFFAATAAIGAAAPGLMERSPVEATRAAMATATSRINEAGNLNSIASDVNRSALIDLGITDPLAQVAILRLGVHTQAAREMIAKISGKSVKDVGDRIYSGQRSLQAAREKMFGDSSQLQGVASYLSTQAGAPVDAINALQFSRDPNRAAAATAFNQASLYDPTIVDKMKSAPIAPGAEKTLKDTFEEQNAKINANYVEMTGVLKQIRDGTLSVRIVEGAEKIRKTIEGTETRRQEDKLSTNLSSPISRRTAPKRSEYD